MKLSLLIADANEHSLEMYRRFFCGCGHVVHTAAGGLECLAKLRELKSGVLILDAALPWGGADGVLARLREEDLDLRSIPVVLTADRGATNSLPSALVAPPVVHCLWKPFRLATLLQTVTAVARWPREMAGSLN